LPLTRVIAGTSEESSMDPPEKPDHGAPLMAGQQEQVKTPPVADVPPTEEEVAGLTKWTVDEVVKYFGEHGFPEHEEVWRKHRITGDRLILLSGDDVKELGIKSIGDRMGIQREIEMLALAARKAGRTEVLYHKTEAWDGSSIDKMCATCCGFFPWDPDKYTLTRSALRIEEYEIPRICGVWKCMCLGGQHKVDNISLDMIRDVDTLTRKKGLCCFAVDKAEVIIAVGAGVESESSESRVVQKTLMVEGAEGEDFANLIFLQIEEYRQTFRVQAKKPAVGGRK